MPEQNPAETPHDPTGDDAAWADLVRRLEEDDPTADRPADPAEPLAPPTPTPVDPGVFRMHPALVGPRDYEVDDTDDGEFVPEDPPPLGFGNPLLVLAWCGATGAPIVLLLAAMFLRRSPTPLWIGLIAVFLLSVGFLMWKLPRHRADNGDDGARI
ncbi:hypothetical protein [Paeniglutamicibacter cryotolerans]|uniref:Uncharacterized protein n=1 Tax=Paeniglutamicibacter cryotolerans TaxID=670079 RepID=A0A839QNU3_9MICC|nr:hypothetical protein [Paeniglutamicibacter cryotolerans]MBB2996305.1 hypothetical protein [Paeniglutamicibacter cryotolerans]